MDTIDKIHWLHHSSFRIEIGGKVLYIDSWKIKTGVPADIIFITHEHHDHFSVEDIDRVKKSETVIVCPSSVAKELEGYKLRKCGHGEVFEVNGVRIETIPAYNIEKKFHTKESGKNGYIIESGGVRLYYAGDTDIIPEMKKLGKINIAMLPCGGTYTMTPEEAAMAADIIKAEITVPMHYGMITGKKSDGELVKNLSASRVEVLIPEEPEK
jgi:L-ascorbate metabolism protein UlaG (beta-lactamase superfamily)